MLLRGHKAVFRWGVRYKSCGIVGLPNVGKSSLFNALTSTQLAQAENYPFCTIEPNSATVVVPDRRLQQLGELMKTERVVLSQLNFTDVAGLVRGAHQGEGLGNKFLATIRECTVLLQVVRCFEDANVIHVESRVDPVSDIKILEAELILSDLESIEKRLTRVKKEDAATAQLLQKSQKLLSDGLWLGTQPWTPEQKQKLSTLHLLSTKPMAYILNVDEGSAVEGNAFTRAVQKELGSSANTVVLSVSLECQASTLGSGHLEYLQLAGLEYTGLERVVRTCADLLGQGYYYTVGKEECRSWTINKNATAQQAAGAIHSDIEKGFIKAEVMTPESLIQHGSEEAVKAKNLMRIEGKEYIVRDGDCMNFKFTERK